MNKSNQQVMMMIPVCPVTRKEVTQSSPSCKFYVIRSCGHVFHESVVVNNMAHHRDKKKNCGDSGDSSSDSSRIISYCMTCSQPYDPHDMMMMMSDTTTSDGDSSGGGDLIWLNAPSDVTRNRIRQWTECDESESGQKMKMKMRNNKKRKREKQHGDGDEGVKNKKNKKKRTATAEAPRDHNDDDGDDGIDSSGNSNDTTNKKRRHL